MNSKRYIYAIFVLLIFLIGIYTFFSPENNAWFPKCIFYQITGLQCPSCGVQRALHSFLTGEFVDAFRYNPLLVVTIPFLLGVAYAKYFNGRVAKFLQKYLLHRYSAYFYLIVYNVWWILRNTPYFDNI